ncbi:hypothetical protein O181_064900 [Austropuccinia psidii MF-1]|uniref:Integrase catalytic domain-containing protein n=1 Tax=Austropuccinia psidii MF-1 TaxID=1389203 RepID=A0A9Q3EU27_9BASI|nr:hypothetical protein [Austropuccinia psidii MF-1]
MENQHDQRIKKLISNQGGEFLNEKFKELSSSCGFTHVFSPAYTPQHNGFAEKANCTILDKSKCPLNGCGLPKRYWAEAVNTTTLLSNLIPTPSMHNHSPYALWTGNSPIIKKLHIFGCQAVVLIQRNLRDWKLGESGYFLSFSIKPPIKQLSTSGHEESLVDEIQPSSDDLPPETQEAVDEVRLLESSSSDIGKGVVDEVHPLHPTLVSCDIAHSNILPYSRRAGALIITEGDVPCTYKMAINSLSKDLWTNAIEKELMSMETLGVWEVVDLSPTFKLVSTTWVFKVKKDHPNNVVEHKARICAQGFTQTSGINFEETYSPTGCLNSLHTLIVHTALNRLLFHQIDIKSAILNAPLAKNVYLSVPQGLGLDQRKVCLRIKKAIYGLKKAPLSWYEHLKGWLISIGLSSCVFHWQDPLPLWLYIHMDDIATFGKDISLFKTKISKELQTKEIGPADLMMGVKVTQLESFLSLNQHHFDESLLELYGMGDCRPVSTPLIPNHHLAAARKEDLSSVSTLKISYRSTIGSLNYLSTTTRPNLSYAVSMLSQFLEHLGMRHWKAFLHALRYLRGTQDLVLVYHVGNISSGIAAYSDADWGNFPDTRRWTTGFLETFDGFLAIWKTRKQLTVSLSTLEAEYKSLCDVTSELLWLRQWCAEAGLVTGNSATLIHEDNQGCISTVNSDTRIDGKRMKHVYIQLQIVREAIKDSKIRLIYTPTSSMLADFLTK